MQKKIINAKSKYWFNWAYGVSIESIRKDLDILEKEGVTNIEIDYSTEYGETYLSFEAFTEREETDEEFQIRILKENEMLEKRRKLELKQLEELKAKYEI